jgi:hypothetical protein
LIHSFYVFCMIIGAESFSANLPLSNSEQFLAAENSNIDLLLIGFFNLFPIGSKYECKLPVAASQS